MSNTPAFNYLLHEANDLLSDGVMHLFEQIGDLKFPQKNEYQVALLNLFQLIKHDYAKHHEPTTSTRPTDLVCAHDHELVEYALNAAAHFLDESTGAVDPANDQPG